MPLRDLSLEMMQRRPSARTGVVVAALAVAATTGAIYAFKHVAPVESTGVLYLLAVLVVSSGWGFRFGLATALASALAWNFFHIPPVHRFSIADAENLVALGVFVGAAAFASGLAGSARARTVEAERRRSEADLLKNLAEALLRSRGLDEARAAMAERLSRELGLASAVIELRAVGGDERRRDVALSADGERVGTLLVPRDTPGEALETLRRLAPGLAALLATALGRQRLEEQLVETEALRRSDVVKTALLRAVSHDLRSPLTAIAAAADGLPGGSEADAGELASVIRSESARLSRLVDDLLDFSKLETGAARPRLDWCSIEEVVASALDSIGAGDEVRLALEPDLPLLQADAAQLERALANLLDNARRHGAGQPVTVQARRVRHHLRVRVTDRGPGVPAEALKRIFEPFYRDPGTGAPSGSGLGLAIARGLVEANGGRLSVESVPGQGASFVIELPLRVRPEAGAPQPAAT